MDIIVPAAGKDTAPGLWALCSKILNKITLMYFLALNNVCIEVKPLMLTVSNMRRGKYATQNIPFLLKDSEIIHTLVFFVAKLHLNGYIQ